MSSHKKAQKAQKIKQPGCSRSKYFEAFSIKNIFCAFCAFLRLSFYGGESELSGAGVVALLRADEGERAGGRADA
ncbi:MAG TPA: hypothetical protein VF290_03680 [Pyrinomonadaceae bacterium]